MGTVPVPVEPAQEGAAEAVRMSLPCVEKVKEENIEPPMLRRAASVRNSIQETWRPPEVGSRHRRI